MTHVTLLVLRTFPERYFFWFMERSLKVYNIVRETIGEYLVVSTLQLRPHENVSVRFSKCFRNGAHSVRHLHTTTEDPARSIHATLRGQCTGLLCGGRSRGALGIR